jgi:hypothetical protein
MTWRATRRRDRPKIPRSRGTRAVPGTRAPAGARERERWRTSQPRVAEAAHTRRGRRTGNWPRRPRASAVASADPRWAVPLAVHGASARSALHARRGRISAAVFRGPTSRAARSRPDALRRDATEFAPAVAARGAASAPLHRATCRSVRRAAGDAPEAWRGTWLVLAATDSAPVSLERDTPVKRSLRLSIATTRCSSCSSRDRPAHSASRPCARYDGVAPA